MLTKSRILNPVQRVESIRDALFYLKGEGIYENRQKHPFPILVRLT
jgi:hypothetical protein